MKIEANFSEISSSFEQLPEGDYRFRLIDITEQEAQPGKSQALMFQSEVVDGEKTGSKFTDFVYTTTKEGKPNGIGLGRIKAYAEAILGEEAANNPSGIDTDDLKNGTFLGLIKHRSYTSNGEQKTGADMKKVLPDR